MLFSILIANYNNGRYFNDCYQSIIEQTYPDWEVIIVDDCSTDDSVRIIQSLIGTDVRFRLYENDGNKGCGFTKRYCAQLATGDVGGFLDPDDALTKDALEVMVKAHEKNEEAVMVHSRFYHCDEVLTPGAIFTRAGQVKVSPLFTNLEGSVNHFATFKMEAYRATGGIDAGFHRAVDQDLYLKLSEQGPFKFVDKALYLYRFHQQGIAVGHPNKAMFWYMKALANAEQRRRVNLERQVSDFIDTVTEDKIQAREKNARYLLLKLGKLFSHNPAVFMKRLLLNR